MEWKLCDYLGTEKDFKLGTAITEIIGSSHLDALPMV